jgi:hypothetical protein
MERGSKDDPSDPLTGSGRCGRRSALWALVCDLAGRVELLTVSGAAPIRFGLPSALTEVCAEGIRSLAEAGEANWRSPARWRMTIA